MGYYLTKSNPDHYILERALPYYRSLPGVSWTICKDAQAGDILFIGQSGKKAGIYAKAFVADMARPDEPDDKFWVDPKEKAGKQAYMAPIESLAVMTHPVLEHLLKRFPELERVVKWLHCQGAVRHLSEEEGRRLLSFV